MGTSCFAEMQQLVSSWVLFELKPVTKQNLNSGTTNTKWHSVMCHYNF